MGDVSEPCSPHGSVFGKAGMQERRATSEQLEQERRAASEQLEQERRAASEQIHDIIKNVMEAYHITAGEAMDVLKIPQPKREYYSEHILHDV